MGNQIERINGRINNMLSIIFNNTGNALKVLSFIGVCGGWIFMTYVFFIIGYIPNMSLSNFIIIMVVMSVVAALMLLMILVLMFLPSVFLCMSKGSTDFVDSPNNRIQLTASYITTIALYILMYCYIIYNYNHIKIVILISFSLFIISVVPVIFYNRFIGYCIEMRFGNIIKSIIYFMVLYFIFYIPFSVYIAFGVANKNLIENIIKFMQYISIYSLLLLLSGSKYFKLIGPLSRQRVFIMGFIVFSILVAIVFSNNPRFLAEKTMEIMGVGFQKPYSIVLEKGACDSVRLITGIPKSCEYNDVTEYGIMAHTDVIWRIGSDVLLSYGLGEHGGFKISDFCTLKEDAEAPQKQRLIKDACQRLNEETGFVQACVLKEEKDCSEPLNLWRRQGEANGNQALIYEGSRMRIVLKKDNVVTWGEVEPWSSVN